MKISTFFNNVAKLIAILVGLVTEVCYSSGHSTEAALPKVVNELFLSLNKGNISVLALLNFSSALDTIDYPILVHRLHTDFYLHILSFNGFHVI